MKIISYNVNGLRAAIKKGFADWLQTHPADVICIQENKAQQSDVDAKLFTDLGYQDYWFCALFPINLYSNEKSLKIFKYSCFITDF